MECLEAISRLSYPRDRFEVIVVDDSNDNEISDYLSPFAELFNIHVLSQKNAGPAAARNRGRRNANGEYLAFTDDDCMPEPDWLDAFAQRILKMPDCALAGKIINDIKGNLFSTASQIIIDYLYGCYNNSDHAQYAVTSNLAMPVEGFNAIGGFDMNFIMPGGEDRDLCARWVDHGFRIIYEPEAVVRHRHSLSLRGFLRQHYNYGRGAFFFHQKRAEFNPDVKTMESFMFYVNLITYPIFRGAHKKRSALVILLALSQVSILAGYIAGRMKKWENLE